MHVIDVVNEGVDVTGLAGICQEAGVEIEAHKSAGTKQISELAVCEVARVVTQRPAAGVGCQGRGVGFIQDVIESRDVQV